MHLHTPRVVHFVDIGTLDGMLLVLDRIMLQDHWVLLRLRDSHLRSDIAHLGAALGVHELHGCGRLSRICHQSLVNSCGIVVRIVVRFLNVVACRVVHLVWALS